MCKLKRVWFLLSPVRPKWYFIFQLQWPSDQPSQGVFVYCRKHAMQSIQHHSSMESNYCHNPQERSDNVRHPGLGPQLPTPHLLSEAVLRNPPGSLAAIKSYH